MYRGVNKHPGRVPPSNTPGTHSIAENLFCIRFRTHTHSVHNEVTLFKSQPVDSPSRGYPEPIATRHRRARINQNTALPPYPYRTPQ